MTLNPHQLLTSPEWLDQQVGSIMEAWLTRETNPNQCRFCNNSLDWEADPAERFCDNDCEEAFEAVQEARVAIGERDLRQRGYD